MSNRFAIVPECVFDELDAGNITARDVAVFAALALHADAGTGVCYPGMEALSNRTGIADVRTIYRATKALTAAKLICKIGGGFRDRATVFRIATKNGKPSQERVTPETPFSEERVTSHAERVTSHAGKGVTRDTPTDQEQTKEQKQRPAYKYADADMKFAKAMFEQIRRVAPREKSPKFEAWANELRLLRERDGRDPKEIKTVFNWANADDFWCTNIRSPSKLREKYSALHAKMIAAQPATPRPQEITQPQRRQRRAPA
ncbi:helix-turn-helix domain-containing protein [Rosistilla oblonga]|uniref:helix-turn-helix domain-containing protein n=1 Tax=Rosistilla oblonga TaxID=2527990 RepID=UPI003A978160